MNRLHRRDLDATPDMFRIPFEGTGELPPKDVVGSKAYNLMRMARQGLPVPPGFVIGTGLCRAYLKQGAAALHTLDAALARELEFLAAKSGRKLGDARRPLLLSVRSGAVVSMPGMMETVLNIGMTDGASRGMTRTTGNPRLGPDCRRRLIAQFAEVVAGMPAAGFDAILKNKLQEQMASGIGDLDTEGLTVLAEEFADHYSEQIGTPFPQEPMAQLRAAVEAVIKSWMSDRAQAYRKMTGISETVGTAVIIQQMVFGNQGPDSGSGVGFTRSPADGSKGLYVDFLTNAQGEDVVSGRFAVAGMGELQDQMPDVHRQVLELAENLERGFGDMQDFEFTVEGGTLYMLQTRSGKRTPLAALQIATDLVKEGIIDAQKGASLLKGIDLEAIELTQIAVPEGATPLATAIPASVGVAAGVALFDPERVGLYKAKGEPLILLRETTETSDIKALEESAALVTTQGARTSHAAVVARQLGRICLIGCSSLIVDKNLRQCTLGGKLVREGDLLTVDGAAGEIFAGELPIRRVKPEALLKIVHSWRNAKPRSSDAT